VKKPGINIEALGKIAEKFRIINQHILNGEEVPTELSKNFISFPLSEGYDLDGGTSSTISESEL